MRYTSKELTENEEIDISEGVSELTGVYDEHDKLVCVTTTENAELIAREWTGHAPFAQQLKPL